MARLRAVVTIHPPGFGGTPAAGQRSAATRNASWTASSAMSMSPKRRIRVATARPDSSRKTCSTWLAAAPVTDSYAGSSWNGRTSTGAAAGDGGLGGPRQRGVEVGGLDDPEAAELLLGLGERAVGRHHVAVLAR